MARWYFVIAIFFDPFRSSSIASLAYFTARDSSSSEADVSVPSIPFLGAGRLLAPSLVGHYLAVILESLEGFANVIDRNR